MPTISDLRQQASTIKNATQVGENTATRVGTTFETIADLLEGASVGQGVPSVDLSQLNALRTPTDQTTANPTIYNVTTLHNLSSTTIKVGTLFIFSDAGRAVVTQILLSNYQVDGGGNISSPNASQITMYYRMYNIVQETWSAWTLYGGGGGGGTIDPYPVSGSNNAVESNGVFEGLQKAAPEVNINDIDDLDDFVDMQTGVASIYTIKAYHNLSSTWLRVGVLMVFANQANNTLTQICISNCMVDGGGNLIPNYTTNVMNVFYRFKQFSGNPPEGMTIGVWTTWAKFGDSGYQPDNEDIDLNAGDQLQFANKSYDASAFSGLGRVYLRKNIVTSGGVDKNVLTQAMVNTANTIYRIQYDYDLNGQTITLPAGCVLEFDGGSLSNGTLVGTHTMVRFGGDTGALKNVTLSGTWGSENVDKIYLTEVRGYNESLSPSDMRTFLQDAIDYASKLGKCLVFPYNKTYTIAIPSMPNTSWEYSSYYAKQGGYGLVIPSNMEVDFNYCTIQVTANDYWKYDIVHFDQNCLFSTIKNGIFIGERQSHTMSGVRPSDEWCCGINIKGRYISVVNCEISELRGDGMVTGGFSALNTAQAIKGTDFSSFTPPTNNATIAMYNAVSGFLTIASYYNSAWSSPVNIQRLAFVLPYSDHRGTKDTIGCRYYIVYYDSGQSEIGNEFVLRGEYCHIPNNAVYMKIHISCDDATAFLANANSMFWICALYPTEHINVDGCYIHDCGRNGISMDAANTHCYKNLNIENISGTNNFIGIDFEGYSGDTTHNIHIEQSRIFTQHLASGGDIAIVNGRSIFVKNCEFYHLYGKGYDVHVNNCTGTLIKLTQDTGKTGVTSSGNRELLAMTEIKNTITDLLYIPSGLVENCSMNRIATDTTAVQDVIACSVPIYRNCKINICGLNQFIQSLMSAKYIDCEIHAKKQTRTYIYAYHNAPATFDGCYIEARNITYQVGYMELLNTTLVHICDNDMPLLPFTKILNSHIILKGNIVYNGFSILPFAKYAIIANSTIEEETNSTIKYALLALKAGSAQTTNLIIRNNRFISHTSGGYILTKNGDNLNGSTILFSENVVDCTDNIKDFSTDAASAYTIRRFNNVYLSNSKLADANIVDVDSPSA